MNGRYHLSQTPHANDTDQKFPREFKDYPRGTHFFDVYSPAIKTLYSQVFWKGLDPVALPAETVERFRGKGMAVVGFEVDQVRRTPEGDVPVPLTVAYNHHFESTIIGQQASFEEVARGDPRLQQRARMGHGLPAAGLFLVREETPSARGLPSQQAFGGANGGEFRKSFHGYAPGFAQVVDSPTQIQITPMQIDTWNREAMNVSHPTAFVAGPLPRSSLAPPGAPYSGLLECPVTTRIRKVVDGAFVPLSQGACQREVASQKDCLDAVGVLLAAANVSVKLAPAGDGYPNGCSAAFDETDRSQVLVHYATSGTAQCEAGAVSFYGRTASYVNVTLQLDVSTATATITATGPSSSWYGIGFNAQAMGDQPWTIIVDGYGNVTERKLGDHAPGEQLASSVTVRSSSVVGGRRTVVLTRPFKGPTSEHYTFDPRTTVLPFINAVGKTRELSYHKDKGPSALLLLPVTGKHVSGACICAAEPAPFGKATGVLQYVPTAQREDDGSGAVRFQNSCPPQPQGDLLAMKNPTCDLRTYSGGQLACHHMWSLLDADQEIPWVDQPIEYHLKFRFWVQEYDPAYHTQVKRTTWGIGSPVEYDVPQCEAGMSGCSRSPNGYGWIHTITGTFKGGGSLVLANFHCHAPTCLSMAMYKCPAGTEVCNATTGELLCEEKPVYGGSGHVEARFDETGYIYQPPCVWGSSSFGLEAAPNVTGFVLGTVKTSNATYGHHGEMAWQQMYFFDEVQKTPDFLV